LIAVGSGIRICDRLWPAMFWIRAGAEISNVSGGGEERQELRVAARNASSNDRDFARFMSCLFLSPSRRVLAPGVVRVNVPPAGR
jgi:hypothetical protein